MKTRTDRQAAAPTPEYLSDAPTVSERVAFSHASCGHGLNTVVNQAGGAIATLRIKDTEYQHGLALQLHQARKNRPASIELLVALEGLYKTFECEVGIQWQGGKSQSRMSFHVFVDDEQVFDSGVMGENDPARKVSVPVQNSDVLRLVATDADQEGMTSTRADWVEARLFPDPTARARIAQTEVDIAPFARVVTSDPNRTTGTAAGRLEEFPAADLFLETRLKPTADGAYAVPVRAEGPSCIGLRWYAMRYVRRLELHWADAACLPAADAVQLQYWAGDSPWQGQWRPLPARFEPSPRVWRWHVANKDHAQALIRCTYRVRWVFPASDQAIILKTLSAFSRASWTTADLRAELDHPAEGKTVRVVSVNGDLLAPATRGPAHTRTWDASRPLDVRIRYSRPRLYKGDRTVLRFDLPRQPVSVAVEDVVACGCVYVPSAGLFVTVNPPPATRTQYRQQIAGKRTVLEQVRSMPDQTFSQAMFGSINPNQTKGPMLLSLACDNRKFLAERDGTIRFNYYELDYQPNWTEAGEDRDRDAAFCYTINSYSFGDKPYPQLVPTFGGGTGERSRHLDGGWLPKPTLVVTDHGIQYRQCTYVAPMDQTAPDGCPGWYRRRAVCVADFTIKNTLATNAECSLRLDLSAIDGKAHVVDAFHVVTDGLLAVVGSRVAAFFDAGQLPPLRLAGRPGGVGIAGRLAPGEQARLVVYLPAWAVRPAEYAVLGSPTRWGEHVERYWKDQLDGAMEVDIPDPLLANVIRASRVHCMVAARSDDRGRVVAPWISSMSYGPLDSESQAVIRGMDMTGCSEFARRGLEFFLKRYNDRGFMTHHYTMVGTGENLWTLAEHHARCGDSEWLKTFAPILVRAATWIVAQRAKTKRLDAHGNAVPEYGLMPPGVTADRNVYFYRFFNDAQYCHGLETIARALAAIERPEAPALLADAEHYRADIVRAYRWMQARCPVVPLADGTWVPDHPSVLGEFGVVSRAELGAHHLAATLLLDPNSTEVARMMDYLEDTLFFRSGMGDYSEERNRKDVFNFGGFSKVQPYYPRQAEIHALRDDVKPFIRSYFNALSSLLDDEVLSLWEHPSKAGGWNKTHETGWFLCQTATMFVMERGDELWLAPMVTNRWMEEGRKVEVRNAPTRFGSVSYAIASSAASGRIDATVEPPTRVKPKRLILRVRHPEGTPIREVTVNGRPHQDFDRRRECVSLPAGKAPLNVRVNY